MTLTFTWTKHVSLYEHYAHSLELEINAQCAVCLELEDAQLHNKIKTTEYDVSVYVCVCVCVCGLGRHTCTNLTLAISKSIQPKFQELFGNYSCTVAEEEQAVRL